MNPPSPEQEHGLGGFIMETGIAMAAYAAAPRILSPLVKRLDDLIGTGVGKMLTSKHARSVRDSISDQHRPSIRQAFAPALKSNNRVMQYARGRGLGPRLVQRAVHSSIASNAPIPRSLATGYQRSFDSLKRLGSRVRKQEYNRLRANLGDNPSRSDLRSISRQASDVAKRASLSDLLRHTKTGQKMGQFGASMRTVEEGGVLSQKGYERYQGAKEFAKMAAYALPVDYAVYHYQMQSTPENERTGFAGWYATTLPFIVAGQAVMKRMKTGSTGSRFMSSMLKNVDAKKAAEGFQKVATWTSKHLHGTGGYQFMGGMAKAAQVFRSGDMERWGVKRVVDAPFRVLDAVKAFGEGWREVKNNALKHQMSRKKGQLAHLDNDLHLDFTESEVFLGAMDHVQRKMRVGRGGMMEGDIGRRGHAKASMAARVQETMQSEYTRNMERESWQTKTLNWLFKNMKGGDAIKAQDAVGTLQLPFGEMETKLGRGIVTMHGKTMDLRSLDPIHQLRGWMKSAIDSFKFPGIGIPFSSLFNYRAIVGMSMNKGLYHELRDDVVTGASPFAFDNQETINKLNSKHVMLKGMFGYEGISMLRQQGSFQEADSLGRNMRAWWMAESGIAQAAHGHRGIIDPKTRAQLGFKGIITAQPWETVSMVGEHMYLFGNPMAWYDRKVAGSAEISGAIEQFVKRDKQLEPYAIRLGYLRQASNLHGRAMWQTYDALSARKGGAMESAFRRLIGGLRIDKDDGMTGVDVDLENHLGSKRNIGDPGIDLMSLEDREITRFGQRGVMGPLSKFMYETRQKLEIGTGSEASIFQRMSSYVTRYKDRHYPRTLLNYGGRSGHPSEDSFYFMGNAQHPDYIDSLTSRRDQMQTIQTLMDQMRRVGDYAYTSAYSRDDVLNYLNQRVGKITVSGNDYQLKDLLLDHTVTGDTVTDKIKTIRDMNKGKQLSGRMPDVVYELEDDAMRMTMMQAEMRAPRRKMDRWSMNAVDEFNNYVVTSLMRSKGVGAKDVAQFMMQGMSRDHGITNLNELQKIASASFEYRAVMASDPAVNHYDELRSLLEGVQHGRSSTQQVHDTLRRVRDDMAPVRRDFDDVISREYRLMESWRTNPDVYHRSATGLRTQILPVPRKGAFGEEKPTWIMKTQELDLPSQVFGADNLGQPIKHRVLAHTPITPGLMIESFVDSVNRVGNVIGLGFSSSRTRTAADFAKHIVTKRILPAWGLMQGFELADSALAGVFPGTDGQGPISGGIKHLLADTMIGARLASQGVFDATGLTELFKYSEDLMPGSIDSPLSGLARGLLPPLIGSVAGFKMSGPAGGIRGGIIGGLTGIMLGGGPLGIFDEWDISKSRKELIDIYSGEKEIEIRRGRWWEFGCQHPDNLMPSNDGIYNASHIYLSRHSIYNGSGVKERPSKYFEYDYKGDMHFVTRWGMPYRSGFTPNHELLVYNGTEIVDRRCDELNGDEYVLVPRLKFDTSTKRLKTFSDEDTDLIQIDNNWYSTQRNWCTGQIQRSGKTHVPTHINLTEDLGFLMGHFLAEGNLNRNERGLNGVEHVCHEDEIDILKRIQSTYESTFGCNANISKGKGKYYRLRISSALIARLFNKLFYCSDIKTMNFRLIYKSPKEFLSGVLKGWFYGDGTVIRGSNKDLIHGWKIKTKAIDSAIAIAKILSGFGVPATIAIDKNTLNGKEYIGHNISVGSYANDILVKQGIVVFKHYWSANQISITKTTAPVKWIVLEDYIGYKIKRIKVRRYSGKVYDFTINSDHHYETALCTTHNSTSFEGSNIGYFRQHWYPRMKSQYQDTATFRGSKWDQFVSVFDKDFYNDMSYLSRPYPMSPGYFENVPILGSLISFGSSLQHEDMLFGSDSRRKMQMGISAGYGVDSTGYGYYATGPSSRESIYEGEGVTDPMAAPVPKQDMYYKVGQGLYHVTELFGLRGFGLQTAIQEATGQTYIGTDVPIFESSSKITNLGRAYWDMQLGGALGTNEFIRRFIPKERGDIMWYNPIPNTMPDWLPGDYYIDFQHGDPYTKVEEGEFRLPGSCLTFDTYVMTLDGFVYAHDIPTNKDVVGLHGQNAQTSAIYQREYTGTVVNIMGTRVTPNHEILIDGYYWVPAGQLIGTDARVTIPRRARQFQTEDVTSIDL